MGIHSIPPSCYVDPEPTSPSNHHGCFHLAHRAQQLPQAVVYAGTSVVVTGSAVAVGHPGSVNDGVV